MQCSVLLTALISLVILAAASPTPGAISKRSFERDELDANFQRDLPEEGKKRDGLETELMLYARHGITGTGAIVTEDKKREELGTAINYDEVD